MMKESGAIIQIVWHSVISLIIESNSCGIHAML